MNDENTILDENEELEELDEQEELDSEELEDSEESDEVEESEDSEEDDDDLFNFDDDEESDDQEEEDALQEEEADEPAEGEEDAEPGTEEEASDKEEVLTNSDLAAYEEFEEAVESTFQQRYGVEFNEFAKGHKAALEDIKVVVKKKNAATSKAMQIVSESGGSDFQKFLQEENADMTVREAQAIADAEANGDFSLSLAFLEKAANKYKSGDKAREKAKTLNAKAKADTGRFSASHKGNPPKTISTGTGTARKERKPSNVFGLDDLGLD